MMPKPRKHLKTYLKMCFASVIGDQTLQAKHFSNILDINVKFKRSDKKETIHNFESYP